MTVLPLRGDASRPAISAIIPVTGRIETIIYKPGKFINAELDKASEDNERNSLVISTPVSVVAALTALARRGVLVKGGVHLESIGKLRALAMDKTGTLTENKMTVVKVYLGNTLCETIPENPNPALIKLFSEKPVVIVFHQGDRLPNHVFL